MTPFELRGHLCVEIYTLILGNDFLTTIIEHKTRIMKYILLFAICLAASALAQTPVDSRKQTVVFKSVNVVPMDSERVLENQDVVVLYFGAFVQRTQREDSGRW